MVRCAYALSGTNVAYGVRVSSYALPTRCPVLASRMVRCPYACGTRCPVLTKLLNPKTESPKPHPVLTSSFKMAASGGERKAHVGAVRSRL
eukprot:3852399-Rhodomonas_salina.1